MATYCVNNVVKYKFSFSIIYHIKDDVGARALGKELRKLLPHELPIMMYSADPRRSIRQQKEHRNCLEYSEFSIHLVSDAWSEPRQAGAVKAEFEEAKRLAQRKACAFPWVLVSPYIDLENIGVEAPYECFVIQLRSYEFAAQDLAAAYRFWRYNVIRRPQPLLKKIEEVLRDGADEEVVKLFDKRWREYRGKSKWEVGGSAAESPEPWGEQVRDTIETGIKIHLESVRYAYTQWRKEDRPASGSGVESGAMSEEEVPNELRLEQMPRKIEMVSSIKKGFGSIKTAFTDYNQNRIVTTAEIDRISEPEPTVAEVILQHARLQDLADSRREVTRKRRRLIELGGLALFLLENGDWHDWFSRAYNFMPLYFERLSHPDFSKHFIGCLGSVLKHVPENHRRERMVVDALGRNGENVFGELSRLVSGLHGGREWAIRDTVVRILLADLDRLTGLLARLQKDADLLTRARIQLEVRQYVANNPLPPYHGCAIGRGLVWPQQEKIIDPSSLEYEHLYFGSLPPPEGSARGARIRDPHTYFNRIRSEYAHDAPWYYSEECFGLYGQWFGYLWRLSEPKIILPDSLSGNVL